VLETGASGSHDDEEAAAVLVIACYGTAVVRQRINTGTGRRQQKWTDRHLMTELRTMIYKKVTKSKERSKVNKNVNKCQATVNEVKP